MSILAARCRLNHQATVTDPYFAYVVSLLHFDGTPGSTVVTDVISRRTWTVTNCDLDASAAVFGPTGLNTVSGGNGNIVSDTTTDFAFPGDYTIEGWYSWNGSGGFLCIYDNRNLSGGAGIAVYVNNGTIEIYNNASLICQSASSVLNAGLTYIRIAKYSGTIYLYASGVLVGSGADSRTSTTPVAMYYGSSNVNGQYYASLMDECRVTNGVARSTGASTCPVPTAPFPNS